MALRTPARSSTRRASLAVPQTPALVKCSIKVDENSSEGDNFTVNFSEDHLTLTTAGELGCGGFGKVYLARTPSGDTFALKVSSKKLGDADFKRLREEVAIMNIFRDHPNIVKLRTAGLHDKRAFVVMERCVPKSLHDLIGIRALDLPEILWIGYQLCDTIHFIHSKACIHRDLKPQNLLFDFQGNLKVTDFGLSSRLQGDNPRKTVAGTAIYMAPEIATYYLSVQQHKGPKQELQYGKEIDVWSIGVVLYVVATRNSPYQQSLQKKQFSDPKERHAALFSAVANARWEWPQGFQGDDLFVDLVEQMLCVDSSKRPSMEQVLKHPVWEMRPLTCPLSLLHSLCLIDPSARASARRSLAASSAINAPAKLTRDQAIRIARAKVESVEDENRALILAESVGTMKFMFQVEELFRFEMDERNQIVVEYAAGYSKARNLQRTVGVRQRSVQLATASAPPKPPSVTPIRVERSVSASSPLLGHEITRSPTGQLVVTYPGRESATKWSLRREISIPQDVVTEVVRCMNRHPMTRMTRIPSGYEGFDCNACDKKVNELSIVDYIWRCHKCDYDICAECATEGRQKPMPFMCESCGKVFPARQKLHKHSLNCRGPSLSPSPERIGMTRQTVLHEESPLEEAIRYSAQARSGRGSTGRLSTASWAESRLSTGPIRLGSEIDSPDIKSPGEVSPIPAYRVRQQAKPSPTARRSARLSVDGVPLEKRQRDDYTKQMNPVKLDSEEPQRKSARRESPKVPEAKTASAERSRGRSQPTQGTTTIELHANQAVKPMEMRKADAVPRKAYSSSRGPSRSHQGAPSTPTPAVARPVHATPPKAVPPAVIPVAHTTPATRIPAVSPQPRPALAQRSAAPQAQQPKQGGFLALPQDAANRKRFLEEFLGGAWMRGFMFSSNDVVIMYYSLQPGRYGGLFPVADGIGTVVVDVNTKTVLYVPVISKEETKFRQDAHPHVQTSYDEEVRILSMSEAQRQVGMIVNGILSYVNETCRMNREGLPSTSIRAAYVHDQDVSSVSANTKFAYVRRVFPEESGMFVLFRLSNMRSHIVCNTAPIDIRWYSDRHKNVTLKYYVHSDASAEPFSIDSTGIMGRLEQMLTRQS